MGDQALVISYATDRERLDCLKLEQKPWSVDVGSMSVERGLLSISSAIHGTSWPEVSCGGLNGVFNATVYAYSCDADLDFTMRVSHGRIVSRLVQNVYREEVIQAGMELEHVPDYPVRKMMLMSWIGRCYDPAGGYAGFPDVDYADGIITFSEKVFGSLRIRYSVRRYVYVVEVSKRLDALENKYDAVAYAVYDGGVEWLEIEAPSGFEKYDGDCGNGAFYDSEDGLGLGLQDGYGDGQLSQTDICSPEYYRRPVAVSANRHIEVDYCSGEVTNDSERETVDWETEKYECD